ncbi:MAG: hypothetical protein HUU16_03835 [Candidatus Omnitrophica bacterium]|nr:hypothetical protein [bacterium]NUN95283.1 hypothetical protein [Candidatus Omnitrophota bacterium]
MKKVLIAIVAVFVAWSVLDILIHGVMLRPSYEASASLWRPEAEMKMGLLYVVTLICAVTFVLIYHLLISSKSLAKGIQYGLLYGIGTGIGMGYGSYAFMPMPYLMALVWFLGSVVECVVAGVIVGAIVTEDQGAGHFQAGEGSV